MELSPSSSGWWTGMSRLIMLRRRGARTRACRVETHLDAWLSRPTICDAYGGRRDESRRGTHECVRYILVSLMATATVLSAEPGLSDPQKQWALATTGIRARQNGDRHDILGGQEKTAQSVLSTARLLYNWWGIDSREGLLKALEGLAREGQRARFEQLGADPSSPSSADREARFAAANYLRLGKRACSAGTTHATSRCAAGDICSDTSASRKPGARSCPPRACCSEPSLRGRT